MLIKEYRITMPLSVEEYQIGQLFSVAQASLNETGGGEGVEVLRNEPFVDGDLLNGQYTSGQYTYKVYHLSSKIPSLIRMLMPRGSTEVHEEAWNAYPYCKTVITNPGYMKQNFRISIETMHYPDDGQQHNIHQLSEYQLKQRDVVFIDIANDRVPSRDYKPTEDPTNFTSTKTGRGPLKNNWKDATKPLMTCYKLVTCEFVWFGLQTKVEQFIHNTERRIFLNFHRQVFCWIDRWHGMTIQDIRELEEKTKEELNVIRASGVVRGLDPNA